MLDFRSGERPRNYFSRREQSRLLLLVTLLGLVFFLVVQARQPEHYAWLWALGQGTRGADPPPAVAGEVDFSDNYYPGVTPEYLGEVRDDFPFITTDRDAWFQLLDILRGADQAKLDAASTGPVTYVQLFQQPDAYRGRLVTLRGVVRRANRVPAPQNDFGIDHYFQVWMTPQDDRDNVLAIYCLELPEGFPQGMDLEESVDLVGFFFKRWVYNAQDRLRTCPVVLAKTLSWHQRPAAPPPPAVAEAPISMITMVLLAVVFAISVTAYVYLRTAGGPRADLGESVDEALLERSEVLPGVDESLKQLGEAERNPRSQDLS